MNDNELTARIETLEAQVRFLYDVLQARIDSTDDLAEVRQAALTEAEDLTPDNRVDGNGIRIADLEAVDDELAGS